MVGMGLVDLDSSTASRNIDGRALSTLLDPYKGLVVISFDRLRRLSRHEKGGYCKEVRGKFAPQYCP